MNYYISIKIKENTIIIETPQVDTTAIFNITSIVINQISNPDNINVSLQNIKNEILEQYHFDIEIGKLISQITID